jgi:hypothetical protein
MKARLNGDSVTTEVLSAYHAPHPRGSSPWILASPSARRARIQLENDSEPLSSHAEIFQGIKTGANDVFIGQLQNSEGSLARIVNGLGDSALIETALLHPVVFGSDIRKYEEVSSNRVLIYPYRHGTVISETVLQESYPLTFAYLTSYRNLLVDRASIVSSGLRWYELVRKRDEAWLQRPKLIIRDLATETSFAIDRAGDTYLVGGTAAVPADSDMILTLLAYLNSAIVTRYLSVITPRFQGGFQKYEPQHLSKIPISNQIFRNSEIAQRLEAYAEGVISAIRTNNEDVQRSMEAAIEQLIEATIASPDQETQ